MCGTIFIFWEPIDKCLNQTPKPAISILFNVYTFLLEGIMGGRGLAVHFFVLRTL